MRSFLHFTTLFCLVSLANASCMSYECPVGSVIKNNGTFFEMNGTQGLLRDYNPNGCNLIITSSCIIVAERMLELFDKNNFGKCIKTNEGYSCSHKDTEDFHHPSYSVEFFDEMIRQTGFSQCKHLRSKFAEWEKQRESCFTKNELLIVCCCIVGFIILCIAGGVGGCVACCIKSRRRQNQPVVAPPAMMGPGMMDPGMMGPGMMGPGMMGPGMVDPCMMGPGTMGPGMMGPGMMGPGMMGPGMMGPGMMMGPGLCPNPPPMM